MRSEKRRLAALAAAIRPKRSLMAQLDKLTADQKYVYEHWHAATAQWHDRFAQPKEAFAALIDGVAGPVLRRDICEVLFGLVPQIPASATLDEAAAIYRLFLEERR